MVMLPLRGVGATLAATVNATDPLPLPLAGGVIVIHGAWLVAVHAQPAFVVTACCWTAGGRHRHGRRLK